jgi:hypothetical protein
MGRLLSIFVISCSLCCSGFAFDDPLNGDWKLVPSKAKAVAKGPVTQFLHIESDQAKLVIVHKGVSPSGEPRQWEIKGDFGGNLIGVLGAPEIDSVRCWRSDARTIMLKLFRDAVAVGYWTAEVSKNGKSLKVTSIALDSAGKEDKTIDQFDRQ